MLANKRSVHFDIRFDSKNDSLLLSETCGGLLYHIFGLQYCIYTLFCLEGKKKESDISLSDSNDSVIKLLSAIANIWSEHIKVYQ